MLSLGTMNRGTGPKKSEPLTIKLSEADKKALQEVCEHEDRPLGYVARELLMRGLAAYNEDHQLRPAVATRKPGVVPVVHLTEKIDKPTDKSARKKQA